MNRNEQRKLIDKMQRENAEVIRKFEIGVVYSCADHPVKIIHIEPPGGLAGSPYDAIVVTINCYGEFSWGSIAGMFSSYDGAHSQANPAPLRHKLQEIPDGANWKRYFFKNYPWETTQATKEWEGSK